MKSLVLWFLCLGLTSALTWEEKYEAWASTLLPGYVIKTQFLDGKRCHCKVQMTSSSSSSFDSLDTSASYLSASLNGTSGPTTDTTTTTTTTTPTTSTTTPTTTSTTTTPTTTSTTTTPTTTSTTTTPTTTSTTTTPTTTTTTTTPTTTSTTTTPTTTTTTPTTTSTTTTPTTTSTTTTPTTTSTTTTPTTTSTTTTPTTTTTTTISTTTTAAAAPVNCDLEITMTSGQTAYWETPNYPSNYPEDITCTLIVHGVSAYVNVALESTAELYFVSSTCATAPDRLEVQNPTTNYYCDTFNKDFDIVALFAPVTLTATFYSSSADGGTAKGFRYKIQGF